MSCKYGIDGDLNEVAKHALQCSRSWVPEARIIGNCRAGDLERIFFNYLKLNRKILALEKMITCGLLDESFNECDFCSVKDCVNDGRWGGCDFKLDEEKIEQILVRCNGLKKELMEDE